MMCSVRGDNFRQIRESDEATTAKQAHARSNNNNNNNNNRKGPNPLTRNYESNGPDVKIRGSAQQIAEKYATLARTRMSAGDRVMAENYLQHAEHYNRIIAAAQAQMPIQHFRDNRDEFDDDFDDERDELDRGGGNRRQAPKASSAFANGAGPQPVIEGTPAEVALNPEPRPAMASGRESARTGFHSNGYNGDENIAATGARAAAAAVARTSSRRRRRANRASRRMPRSRARATSLREAT